MTHSREQQDVQTTTSAILKVQLPLLVGNLVVDFAGTLCLKHKITLSSNDGTESNDAGHSTSRLVQATKCFTKDGWSQKVGLPPKYHTTLQDLPVVCYCHFHSRDT